MSNIKTSWLIVLVLVVSIGVTSMHIMSVFTAQQAQKEDVKGVSEVYAQTTRSQKVDEKYVDPEEPYLPDQSQPIEAVRFIQNLMSFGQPDKDLEGESNDTTVGNQTNPDETTETGPLLEKGDLSLIFNEVAGKINMPAKLLSGVMKIECPAIFQLSDQEIATYSQPGQGIPASGKTARCYRNNVGAMGPMQFMSGTWPGYANAVNKFGGYTHKPNVENIRDSAYAGARMYYLNSGKTEAERPKAGQAWSRDQVLRSVICYNAGCGRLSKSFEDLPKETQKYFNTLWAYYTSK